MHVNAEVRVEPSSSGRIECPAGPEDGQSEAGSRGLEGFMISISTHISAGASTLSYPDALATKA